MREDDILERARQEVVGRQLARVEHQWGGWKRWGLPLLALVPLLVFAAVPRPLPEKLFWLMGGVCGLRPLHSYFAGETQLPLEARMLGIYSSALLAAAGLLAGRRWGARRLGSARTVGLLGLMFASMALDGINSTLIEQGLPQLYTTTNSIRLLTGVLAGTALGAFMVWLSGVVLFAKRPADRPLVVTGPRDMAVLLGVGGGVTLAVLSGQAWLYYPLALLGVGGIIASVTAVLVFPIVSLSGSAGRITHVPQLIAPGALALLFACLVVAGLATLRWATIGALV